MSEKTIQSIKWVSDAGGRRIVLLGVVGLAGLPTGAIMETLLIIALGVVLLLVAILIFSGLFIVNPNEAKVMLIIRQIRRNGP